MFSSKLRIESAWAKGLMLGKAVGARDERMRIMALLNEWLTDDDGDFQETLDKIRKGKE